MQNIFIRRFPDDHKYAGCVVPEDRNWLVLIQHDGEAIFYRMGELRGSISSDRKFGYVDAEFSWKPCLLETDVAFDKIKVPEQEIYTELTDWDFEVTPMREPKMDVLDSRDAKLEDEKYPDRRNGFAASLVGRHCWSWGETEHEAIRRLMIISLRDCFRGILGPKPNMWFTCSNPRKENESKLWKLGEP